MLKAKDFATEITIFNTRARQLGTELAIASEHITNEWVAGSRCTTRISKRADSPQFDIARYKGSERTDYIIQNWLRNRNTIELLGIWEQLNNPTG